MSTSIVVVIFWLSDSMNGLSADIPYILVYFSGYLSLSLSLSPSPSLSLSLSPPLPPSLPPIVEEVFITINRYSAQHHDEATFEKGVLVEVFEKGLDGWWKIR